MKIVNVEMKSHVLMMWKTRRCWLSRKFSKISHQESSSSEIWARVGGRFWSMLWRQTYKLIICLIHNLQPSWPLPMCWWDNRNGWSNPSSRWWTSMNASRSHMWSNMEVDDVKNLPYEIQSFALLDYLCHICTLNFEYARNFWWSSMLFKNAFL